MDSTCIAIPTGPLSFVVNGDGAVTAAGFCPVADLEARLGESTTARPDLGDVSKIVAAYLDGDLTAIDTLVVAQKGTALQQRVWSALREIPAGATTTYGALAARLALTPGTARAVGSACGRNLVAPFVPCHRVVGADGKLTGFYYGLTVKEWLLSHEKSDGQTSLI